MLYLAAEFAVVYVLLAKTCRQYCTMASGYADSVLGWFVLYVMMQFVPWVQLRIPNIFSGAWFARWVAWRLITNTVAFALLANDTVMWRYYGALLGAAVVGMRCHVQRE